MNNLDKDQKVGLILRVKFKDLEIRSYSFLQVFDKHLYNDLYKTLEDFLSVKNEDYKDEIVIELIFSYFLLSNKSIKSKILNKDRIVSNTASGNINKKSIKKYLKFAGYNFPVTSDFSQ
jgi:hypothetical protein